MQNNTNTAHLTTEKRNDKSVNLDKMTALEFCQVMNDEDANAVAAVKAAIPQVAKIIDLAAEKLKNGGRLVYMGAGTSGRLGLMDAVECVPTFGVPHGLIVGLIAGGENAFVKAVEGAEDSREFGEEDLKRIGFNNKDLLIGIAASGRTPYVIGGMKYARSCGAAVAALSCNSGAEISSYADIAIEADAGPEVLTGSTRLKAGTVQKLILNMISTGAMAQCGKVYKNLMVDVLMTNDKLRERGRRIIMQATGADYKTADECLQNSGNSVKTAIVMVAKKCTKKEAEQYLAESGGFVSSAIEK
ncbi:MAG: N-acetylmuramic acid 6-phosphate etherase [Deferribacteraceae bacterium]|nr:N-acetylmuramic acid 6-phosphate etherase [Deferribacteraceae bacterium]